MTACCCGWWWRWCSHQVIGSSDLEKYRKRKLRATGRKLGGSDGNGSGDGDGDITVRKGNWKWSRPAIWRGSRNKCTSAEHCNLQESRRQRETNGSIRAAAARERRQRRANEWASQSESARVCLRLGVSLSVWRTGCYKHACVCVFEWAGVSNFVGGGWQHRHRYAGNATVLLYFFLSFFFHHYPKQAVRVRELDWEQEGRAQVASWWWFRYVFVVAYAFIDIFSSSVCHALNACYF